MSDGPNEHVILVAVVVAGPSREEAEKYLHTQMPKAEEWHTLDKPAIDSWWVAEDDRRDGSDCDSATFCKPGKQAEATKALQSAGLAH